MLAWKASREALQASNRVFRSGASSIGAMRGATAWTRPRSTGKKKQNGSFSSNRTRWPGRVNRQFMVKVKGDQSVSIRPLRGAIPSFMALGEPPTHRLKPCDVRNNPSTWKVSTPWPNSATGILSGGAPASGRTTTSFTPGPPFHSASNPQGLRTSQPWALAMLSGRQR